AAASRERGGPSPAPGGQGGARARGEGPIPEEKLVIGRATADDPKTPLAQIAESFAGQAPLWAYILSEAQVTSWENADSSLSPDDIPIKLGPVGGRIVAGVFAALLHGDRTSYLNHHPAFTPIPAFTRDGKFGLAELINVALGRKP